MVKIDNNFTQAVLEDEDKYEGTNIDANVAAALPEGAKIVWVSTMGATHWSILTKIDTTVDGKPRSFFLKEYKDANAKGMDEAEHESIATLYAMTPDNVPRPLAYGSSAADSKRFFYLQSSCHMTDAPSQDEIFISTLVALLAGIHRKDSPTGKFGFHITTFQGNIPNDNQWCDTWEEYFGRNLSNLIDLERAIHGVDPKMDVLSSALMRKVVLRLLRPMETGSNKIKPVLLHGDMWHGNVSVDIKTQEPILYDSGSFYGHNEYEAAPWRAARYQFGEAYRSAYCKLVNASEPKEDCEDKVRAVCVAKRPYGFMLLERHKNYP